MGYFLRNGLVGLCLLILSLPSFALTTFTYRGKEHVNDTRSEYSIVLFRLALEKTVSSHGSYKLDLVPRMNSSRALKSVEGNLFSNFFTKLSVSTENLKQYSYADFPVDLGIVGYRVFFVSAQSQQALQAVDNIEQLKEFTIGQGAGWLDSEILKYHNFKVVLGGTYQALFKMVAKGRFDLFSRGSNELLAEYQAHQNIEGLLYDKHIALYYPLPRFFFTNKANADAANRIKQGLLKAYYDGSLMALWKKYYGESLDFVDLRHRKIFRLDNPYIEGIDPSYQQYIYQP
ncbi:hypothetical protein [Agarivorans sp. QJM3NY_25]|uniref:hypothetical protein n=1 Tax=Agarivorans sp. QJM3NY_25 TaxID=3421430 RepID=UPI003D7E9C01